MGTNLKIVAKPPDQFNPTELDTFTAMVRAGGEVGDLGLIARVKGAERLTYLYENDCLVGVAALKNPHHSYKLKIEEKTDVSLSAFSYELGYIFVMPSARRKGYSALLVDDALKAANGKGVFATSRTTNTAMWKTLERYSFKKTGNVYLARNRKDKIQLFLRPAHNIEEDLLRRK